LFDIVSSAAQPQFNSFYPGIAFLLIGFSYCIYLYFTFSDFHKIKKIGKEHEVDEIQRINYKLILLK